MFGIVKGSRAGECATIAHNITNLESRRIRRLEKQSSHKSHRPRTNQNLACGLQNTPVQCVSGTEILIS